MSDNVGETTSSDIREIRSGTRRLSSTRIISRILESAKEPKFRFQLLNDAVISRATLSRYVSLLIDRGMLEQIPVNGKVQLRTTELGKQFLRGKSSGVDPIIFLDLGKKSAKANGKTKKEN
jgi:predicted transcriptional regulator